MLLKLSKVKEVPLIKVETVEQSVLTIQVKNSVKELTLTLVNEKTLALKLHI